MSAERRTECLLLALATLGSGAFTLVLGQDVNFDQVSYHVYLGWSLLADRLDVDIAPVGHGTFMNPLLQALQYAGLTLLPVRLFFALLGAVHGLNAFLVYRLARRVLRGAGHERVLAAAAGVVAAAGPCAVSMLGTTFGDNTLSLLVLGGFVLLARAADEPEKEGPRRVALAGGLAGAAFGLKLTCAFSAFALLASALFIAVRQRRLAPALAFGSGSAAGLALTTGYWSLRLWRKFGDPFFPFGQALFASPFTVPTAGLDPRFASAGMADILAVPVQLAIGQTNRLQEVPARDVRHLLLLVLTLAAALVWWFRPGRAREASTAAGGVVIAGWLALFGAWTLSLHYYRYFAAGEFLAPVALLALLRIVVARRALPAAWLATAALVVATTATGSWGRGGWTPGPLDVRVPMRAEGTAPIVLVDGYGVSFAFPFFPAGTRFFGLTGTGSAFRELVAREVARGEGPLYRVRLRALPATPLDALGLRDAPPCEDFRTGGRGRLVLCRLERVGSPREAVPE